MGYLEKIEGLQTDSLTSLLKQLLMYSPLTQETQIIRRTVLGAHRVPR